MPDNTYSDTAPWQAATANSKPPYKRIKRTSQYLEMRDGVRIAVDLYLPRGLKRGSKLATIIHQTRYYRRFDYRKLLRPYRLRREVVWQEIKRLVQNAYAVVNVDVRGTGASFGTREVEFSPEEVKDSAEIVDWIVGQPWSNEFVGSLGTSYTGSTAELLLTNQHPAVKAAVIRYANFDAYPDVINPGGVLNENFLRIWSELNAALDNGRLPQYLQSLMGWKGRWPIRNVSPVDGDGRGKQLAEAQKAHRENLDIYTTARQVRFRDDITDQGHSLELISPCTYIDDLEASGAAIYSWSSWYDGGFTRSAIKRFMHVNLPQNHLILGPWDHGGWQVPDPHTSERKSRFDHTAEVLRFFDLHLKGVQNGIDSEPAVRYFTMGEGAWKSADTWPPPGFNPESLFIAGAGKLAWGKPPEETGLDVYQVDNSASSGVPSRWLSLVNITDIRIGYPDRADQDQKLLVYQSQPLDAEIEVTGHPVITLYVRSSAEDGAFFVYLEDVTPAGDVVYVTEGQFRALHRKISAEDLPNSLPVPQHSFKRADAVPLIQGEVAKLKFDLLPVSYLFRRGHALRLAVAGADRDNFELVPETPPLIEVLWGKILPSRIELPVKHPGNA
jgi:putative CocE/NonD family hydrolase